MVRRTEWNDATILESCRSLRRERIRIFAWVSIKVTSMSAMAALVSDVYLLLSWLLEQLNWGYAKNWANGLPWICLLSSFSSTIIWWLLTLLLLLSPCSNNANFLASSDCRMCSSSFTNSIAPPTIEAWSPYTIILNIIKIWLIDTN